MARIFCCVFAAPGLPRHLWAPLTPQVAAMLGLEKEAASPQAALLEWKEAFENEAPPGVLPTQDFCGDFLPSEDGWPVRLLDGVMSRRSGSDVTQVKSLGMLQNGGWPTEHFLCPRHTLWNLQSRE